MGDVRRTKGKKFDWDARSPRDRGMGLRRIDFNPETGCYLYKRIWTNGKGIRNWCFEVVRPVGENRAYPGNDDFSKGYGVCLSKEDKLLDEKIEHYMSNGLSRRY